jgi:hypothetical protein
MNSGEYLSQQWANFQAWKEDVTEQLAENYYIYNRAVLHGFPFATITTLVAGVLFDCAKPSQGAIFGAANYVVLTSLVEITHQPQYKFDETTKAAALLGISSAVSWAFTQTVCKTSLTYKAAIVLSVAAFAGQVARLHYGKSDEEL